MNRVIILLLIGCFIAGPVSAVPPVPESKKAALNKMQEDLQKFSKQQMSLEEKIEKIEGDLKSTRKQLVKTSRLIQSNEKELLRLENQIKEREDEKAVLMEKLLNDRHQIGKLIMAMRKIEEVPPEAIIIRPGAPLKTAQSAMIMEDIVERLKVRTKSLNDDIERLQQISEELLQKRSKVAEASNILEADYKKLAGLIAQKQDVFSESHKDLKAQQQEVTRISLQSNSMKDLLKNLEDEREEARQRELAKAVSMGKPSFRIPSAIPSQDGGTRLPLSGIIRVGYGQTDHLDAQSQGLWIEGRAGALIVAPMSGVIRYAGPFKNYGNIVIVEHKKGYHSLIAGLEKVDTLVGHSVVAGEPLGILARNAASDTPMLYYELRRGGRAVDPAEKFSDLS